MKDKETGEELVVAMGYVFFGPQVNIGTDEITKRMDAMTKKACGEAIDPAFYAGQLGVPYEEAIRKAGAGLDAALARAQETSDMLDKARRFPPEHALGGPMPLRCDDCEVFKERDNLRAQMGLIEAALRRAGIEEKEGVPTHYGVTQLSSRYLLAQRAEADIRLRLKKQQGWHEDLKSQYRDLFGAVNQAARKVGHDDLNGHYAAMVDVGWLAEDLKDVRSRLASLAAHANEVTAERDSLQKAYDESQKLIAALERKLTEPASISAMAGASAITLIPQAEYDRLQKENILLKDNIAFGNRYMVIRPKDYDALTTAESEKERILAKLKLKSGTPVEIVLDTINSLQQHAAFWRIHNREMANGDILIAKPEYDRLLKIERGHQADAAEARSARADRKEITEALGLPEGRDVRDVVKKIRVLMAQEPLYVADLRRKLATLRNIVLRKAPHTGTCLTKHNPHAGGNCGCWKAEFLAEADKS